MVADLQSHMAAVAQLSNVLPFPQYPITPSWNTALLTRTEMKITASRHSSGGITMQGRTLLCQKPEQGLFLYFFSTLFLLPSRITGASHMKQSLYLVSHSSQPASYLYVGWKEISPSVKPSKTAFAFICLFSYRRKKEGKWNELKPNSHRS